MFQINVCLELDARLCINNNQDTDCRFVLLVSGQDEGEPQWFCGLFRERLKHINNLSAYCIRDRKCLLAQKKGVHEDNKC